MSLIAEAQRVDDSLLGELAGDALDTEFLLLALGGLPLLFKDCHWLSQIDLLVWRLILILVHRSEAAYDGLLTTEAPTVAVSDMLIIFGCSCCLTRL